MYIKPLCCCWQCYELLQVVMLISLSILANTRAFQNGFTDRANSGRADVKNWADSCSDVLMSKIELTVVALMQKIGQTVVTLMLKIGLTVVAVMSKVRLTVVELMFKGLSVVKPMNTKYN